MCVCVRVCVCVCEHGVFPHPSVAPVGIVERERLGFVSGHCIRAVDGWRENGRGYSSSASIASTLSRALHQLLFECAFALNV